jgi:hypothetical protein
MENCLTQAFKGVIAKVPFPIEARVADSWGIQVVAHLYVAI